jgi:hypothetical protein
MPEIPTRTITITNTGETPFNIDSIVITPAGLYVCKLNTPFNNILPQQTITIEIECLDISNIQTATMKLYINPCNRIEEVLLVPYSSTANITIPTNLIADPRDDNFAIPVLLTQTENYSYNGIRIFEAEFTIGSDIFYPKYAASNFGEAKIISNTTENNVRTIKVRFDGNINNNNTELLRIYGAALLGHTDTSSIN